MQDTSSSVVERITAAFLDGLQAIRQAPASQRGFVLNRSTAGGASCFASIVNDATREGCVVNGQLMTMHITKDITVRGLQGLEPYSNSQAGWLDARVVGTLLLSADPAPPRVNFWPFCIKHQLVVETSRTLINVLGIRKPLILVGHGDQVATFFERGYAAGTADRSNVKWSALCSHEHFLTLGRVSIVPVASDFAFHVRELHAGFIAHSPDLALLAVRCKSLTKLATCLLERTVSAFLAEPAPLPEERNTLLARLLVIKTKFDLVLSLTGVKSQLQQANEALYVRCSALQIERALSRNLHLSARLNQAEDVQERNVGSDEAATVLVGRIVDTGDTAQGSPVKVKKADKNAFVEGLRAGNTQIDLIRSTFPQSLRQEQTIRLLQKQVDAHQRGFDGLIVTCPRSIQPLSFAYVEWLLTRAENTPLVHSAVQYGQPKNQSGKWRKSRDELLSEAGHEVGICVHLDKQTAYGEPRPRVTTRVATWPFACRKSTRLRTSSRPRGTVRLNARSAPMSRSVSKCT